MLVTLSVQVALLLLAVLLMALSPVARRAAQRLRDFEDTRARGAVSSTPSKTEVDRLRESLAPQPIPPEESGGHFMRQVLTGAGMLGALLTLPMLALFPLNARILGEGFEVLLNHGPVVQFIATWHEWQWEVTDFQLYGITLNTSLLFLTAAAADAIENRRAYRGLVAAVVGWFGIYEIGLAAYRGYHLADPGAEVALALASGGQALVTACAEVIAGHFAIHRFLVPLLLALTWGFVAPFRAMARVLGRRWRMRRALSTLEVVPKPPGLFTRLLAFVDEAFLEPLRALDGLVATEVARVWPGRTPRAEEERR